MWVSVPVDDRKGWPHVKYAGTFLYLLQRVRPRDNLEAQQLLGLNIKYTSEYAT